jgi:hypothetical protein
VRAFRELWNFIHRCRTIGCTELAKELFGCIVWLLGENLF